MTITTQGLIKIIDNSDSGDGLMVDDEPLSSQLEELSGKHVTVRFFISDTERTPQELKENLILQMSGSLYARYGDAYSEYTGYLWATDDLKIDGHDLLDDIASHVGKYLYMECDIHEKQ